VIGCLFDLSFDNGGLIIRQFEPHVSLERTKSGRYDVTLSVLGTDLTCQFPPRQYVSKSAILSTIIGY